mgnify:CR=1 FL=1
MVVNFLGHLSRLPTSIRRIQGKPRTAGKWQPIGITFPIVLIDKGPLYDMAEFMLGKELAVEILILVQ